MAELVKNLTAMQETVCHTGDLSSIPGSGSSLGEGNGYPLQYSCLENSMGRGAWWAAAHKVPKSGPSLRDQPSPLRESPETPIVFQALQVILSCTKQSQQM